MAIRFMSRVAMVTTTSLSELHCRCAPAITGVDADRLARAVRYGQKVGVDLGDGGQAG